jgi:uncharacterized repeat protein (TIGR01451 family)
MWFDTDPIFRPDLVVTKTASVASPDFVVPGQPLTFTITVANTGSGEATGVEVTDTFEAGLVPLSSSCGASIEGNLLTWSIGTLASAEVVFCEITATVASCFVFTNTATATLNEGDENPADNTSTVVVNDAIDAVRDGGFEAFDAMALDNPFWDEASTNFMTPLCDTTICPTSAGRGPRTGEAWGLFGRTVALLEMASVSQQVVIPVDSDALLKFYFRMPISSGATTDEFTVKMDGMELFRAQGDDPTSFVFQQVVIDVSSFADGAPHTLSFEAITQNPTATYFVLDDVTLAACPRFADLSITKSDSSDPVAAGGTLAYTLVVSNAGPATATAVTVEDTLPAAVTLDSTVSSTGTFDVAGNLVTWSLGPLASGSQASAEITVTVDAGVSGEIVNTATVKGSVVDANAANDVAMETTTVALPEIDVTPASVDFGVRGVDSGQTPPTTVTISNTGGAPLAFTGMEVALTGADTDEFNIASDSGENPLPPAMDRTVGVTFDPSSAETTFNAVLTITSSDLDEPVVTVTLTGTGAPSGPTGLATVDLVNGLLKLIPVPTPFGPFDVNGDGQFDSADVVENVNQIDSMGTAPAEDDM